MELKSSEGVIFSRNKGWLFPAMGKLLPFSLLFLYFLTSSGELLHTVFYIFKPKIGHLVAVIFFGYFFIIFKKMTIPRPIVYAFLWLLLSQCISAFFSVHIGRSSGYIGVYLFNFIFFFLVPVNLFRVFESAKILKIYFFAFCCMGLYTVAQVIFSLFDLYDPLAWQRIGPVLTRGQGWTYEPSYYALYITAFVMFKNATAILKAKQKFSWKESAKLVGINFLLVISFSTGLVLSYPAFCVVTLWVSLLKPLREGAAFVKWRIVKFLAFCCAIGGVISLLFWDIIKLSIFKVFYWGFNNHGSFFLRWEGIVNCWKIFLEHLFFGVGIGGVGPYISVKNSCDGAVPQTLKAVEAHDPTNVFTEVLASLGLVGLIGLVILAWAFYKAFRKVIASRAISADEKSTAEALFISLIVLLIVLQFNQGLFRPYIWIHAGIVYGYLHSRGLSPNRQQDS
jgi:hypothetical protein